MSKIIHHNDLDGYVSKIAEKYGGGGHKGASGAHLSYLIKELL